MHDADDDNNRRPIARLLLLVLFAILVCAFGTSVVLQQSPLVTDSELVQDELCRQATLRQIRDLANANGDATTAEWAQSALRSATRSGRLSRPCPPCIFPPLQTW
ncbi:MAG TPA: hypothetical protein VH475_14585 [Tepidisphaeraceae bacterium]|jgi:hypothetical protein